MTGGQPVDGGPTVTMLAAQIAAEGIKRIAIVADEAERLLAKVGFAAQASPRIFAPTWTRCSDRCAITQGPSVLIYDQVCATEKRRRRKRGSMAQSTKHVMINEAVCEELRRLLDAIGLYRDRTGGDAGLGRKRRINTKRV